MSDEGHNMNCIVSPALRAKAYRERWFNLLASEAEVGLNNDLLKGLQANQRARKPTIPHQ